MINNFKPIPSWSAKSLTRNIEICLLIASGKTYRETGIAYDISGTRVMQIYGKFLRTLRRQQLDIPEIIPGSYPRGIDILKTIQEYKKNYIDYIKKENKK